MDLKITKLSGDGIGPEVINEAVKVCDAICKKYNHKITWNEGIVGADAIKKVGNPYPDETHTKCLDSDAVLFGAIGDPKFDKDPSLKIRPEQGLLSMRKKLGLYANIRPTFTFKELIDMCNLKKELELKYELETNVNLINFKNGYIEISFNENLKKDFVKILSSKLYEWTNTRWIISLSQDKGQETIKKTSEGEKKNNLKEFEQTDMFNNIKKSFPDAELIDVKDNKDD